MVVGLYSALATTAGVFVGLLTAYLVSRIVGMKAERRRIEKRIQSIDARIDSLQNYQAWREDQLSNMDERNAEINAIEQVEEFIDEYVGNTWSPQPQQVDFNELKMAFIDYMEMDSIEFSKYHATALAERQTDALEELQPKSSSFLGYMEPPDIPPSTEIIAANRQTQALWDIHRDTVYEQRNSDYVRISTEMKSLTNERERLVGHYNESDPTELMNVLRSTGGIILLSVFVPLAVYLFHSVNVLITIPRGASLEPVLVFLSWCVGLALTYKHIRQDVLTSENSLPESPLNENGFAEENSDSDENNSDR
jgi:hypothetical protein